MNKGLEIERAAVRRNEVASSTWRFAPLTMLRMVPSPRFAGGEKIGDLFLLTCEAGEVARAAGP
jgi:hypothetical protein